MANYSELLNDINAAIYENNDQEIDALEVRAILREMVTSLGSGFLFKDVATPSSPTGTGTYEPDQNVYYYATTPGTYTYLGGLVVNPGEVALLCYDGTWFKKSTDLLSKSSIVDNLTTNDATKPLSAKQGKVLADAGAATSAEVTALGQEVGGNANRALMEIGFEKSFSLDEKDYVLLRYNGTKVVATDPGGTSIGIVVPCTSQVIYSFSGPNVYSRTFYYDYPEIDDTPDLSFVVSDNSFTAPADGFILFTIQKNTGALVVTTSERTNTAYQSNMMYYRSDNFAESVTFNLKPFAAIVKRCIRGIWTTDRSLFSKKLILRVFGKSGTNLLIYINDSSSVADSATPDVNSTNVDKLTYPWANLGTGIKRFVFQNGKIICNIDVDLLQKYQSGLFYVSSGVCYNNAALTLSGYEDPEPAAGGEDVGIRLNGVDGWFEMKNNIVLQNEGDELEIGLWTNEAGQISDNHGYAFAYNPNSTNKIGLGVTTTSLALKVDTTSGWQILVTTMKPYGSADFLPLFNNMVIKVKYEDSKIKMYRNGILIAVYNGQNTMTISSFGKADYATYGYWSGEINYIKVNGSKLNLEEDTIRHNAPIFKNKEGLAPIRIARTDSGRFNVYSLNKESLEYVAHTFRHFTGTRTIGGVSYITQDVWSAEDVLNPNGDRIYQGNLNAIYKVGKVNGVASSDASVNENYHVGPGHGCEVALFTNFLADGKEFAPDSVVGTIECSAFRFVMKSECYVVDSSYNSGNNNNYPKIADGEPIVHANHYIDAIYEVDSAIKMTNRLVQVRNAAIQYIMLCGAMLEGNILDGIDTILNDTDISYNHIELNSGGSDYPTYTAPDGYSSEIIDGEYIAANVVIMEGNGRVCRQSITHTPRSVQGNANVYTHSNQNDTSKCYLNAVGVINSDGMPIDTLNEGDIVEVIAERKIEVAE